MSSLWILNGRVLDPANGIDGRHHVVIREGRIAEIVGLEVGPEPGAEVIDAAGHWVVPGLVDIHVHLREPGYEYKETVATGTRAAVAGGFTSVACMANTNPVNDSGAVTEYIVARAREAGLARVFPIGAVTKGLAGRELAEMGEMQRAGIVAVSDDGMPIMDGGLMRRALEYARMLGLPVIVHEEDRDIACGGVMNEGEWSARLGLRGMPAAAEEAMIGRDLALLERTGGRLHVAHLSTAGSVELVRRARQKGLPVTAEVTPHHFCLTEAACSGYDTNAKMNPPLRTAADVAAVIAGLADGTIDCIATDHAPHHRDEKEVEFDRAANGIVGLETALPLSLELVREAGIPESRIIEALTVAPARVLGLPVGTLSVGAPADVTILDPERPWSVDPDRFESKSRNSPFGGRAVRGATLFTLVDGRIVWRADTTSGAH